jgi:hypothetical protein
MGQPLMNNADFAEKSYDLEQINRLRIILAQNNQIQAVANESDNR